MYISLNGFWGRPDLIVSSLGTNKITYRAGESLRITATTRNIGSSRVGYSYTKFYLSRDRYLNSSDTYLGSDYVSSLGAGSSSTDTMTKTLGGNLSGRYYLIAKADAYGWRSESNEGNNIRVLSPINIVQAKPDLIVSSLGTNKTTYRTGESLRITSTTRNIGNASVGSSYTRFYLSRDRSLGSSDTYLGSDYVSSLGAGSSSTDTMTRTLGGNLSGRYYLIAKADAYGWRNESNEGNNIRVLSPINIVQAKPDLIVSSLGTNKITYRTGESLRITATTRNIGNSRVGYSYTKFYLSRDRSLGSSDTYMGYDYVSSLGAGSSSTDTMTKTLGGNLSGSYYLIAKADAYGWRNESNEGNNIRVLGPINITQAKPDLIVTGGTARMIDSAMGRMYANVTVRNQGTATAGSSYVAYYLSTNSTITTLDTRLSVDYTGSLASGRSEYDYQYFNLPKNLVAGRTYYIGAIADYSNRVGESNEGNNGRVLGSFIAPPPRKPDLIVTGGTARMIDSGTGRMYANVTVRNQGTGTAGSSYVGYYLSTNSTITTLDTRLSVDYTGSLASGRSEYDYQYFNLPKNLVAGRTYYIGAIADYSNRVGESNEGNNARLLGSFTVKPVNRAPVVTTYNKTVESGKALSASSLFRVTDADGDAMTRYEFRDGGAGGGYFKVDGVTRSSGQAFQVSASRLGSVRYHGGANAGSETLSVRAYDGKTWSAWKSLTATTTKSKVDITTRTHVVDANEQIRVSSLPGFVASGVSQLQFFDSNADGNSGYFKLGGARKSGVFSIAGSDLGNLYFVGGKGDNRRFDDLYVRAKAGSTWGEWSRVSIATEPHHDTALLPNHKPKWNGNNVTFSFMTQLPTPLSQQVVLQGLQGIQFTSEIRHARGVAKMGRGLRPDLHGGERCGLRWPDAFRFRELGRVRPCLLSSNRRCMVEHDIQRPDQ